MPLPNLLGGLMDHDPLCPLIVDGVEGPLHLYECPCDLIAKVRQDEEEKARDALEAQAKRIIEMADVQAAVAAAMASDDMLERCIAAVETVAHWTDSDMGLPLTDRVDEKWVAKGNAVAALRALGDQP